MSFLVTAPELVTTAAENLAGIGSTIEDATAAARVRTTGLATAAADEVSIAVSELFSNYGQEFQTLSTRGAAYHSEFVQLLNGSAAAYVATDIANAAGNLVDAPVQSLRTLWTPGAAAAAAPGGAYGQLIANTVANMQTLGNAWAADPFPFLRQFLANQQTYAQGFATALASLIQNFPANLANLPAAIQLAFQQFLSFNAAYYLQQFVATQIGFAQTFGTTFTNMIGGLVTGLPQFGSELSAALGALVVGDYTTAVDDLGSAVANLLVKSIDPGPVAVSEQGLSIVLSMNPTLVGPLGDFFTLMNLPSQEAQYLTNLTTPPQLRHLAQNFTNVLNTLTLPTISARLVQPLTEAGTLNAFFGMPLVFTYAALGAPFSALNQLAISLESVEYALGTGNLLGAAGALIDAPANALNGFLNVSNVFDMPIVVPTGFSSEFLPSTVLIVLHVPVDGLLVAPHPFSGTISFPNYPIYSGSFEVTVFGTPFMGLAPLLVNYMPQQLAQAITPAA